MNGETILYPIIFTKG